MELSFIIPVFNCTDTLESCVESIRSAGLADYEIILIDDGSADGSAALCDALSARFPEVRVHHQNNAGAAAARNAGLELAAGERIIFVDGDDAVDGPALRAVLEQDADLLLFGHSGAAVTESSDPVILFRENLLPPVWNKVFRRRIIAENHLRFREELFVYEDLEFVLRYLSRCGSIQTVPITAYRCRPSGRAGQRMKGLTGIFEVLGPISDTLTAETAPILPLLAEILARERIAVASLAEIPNICREFKRWHPNGNRCRLLSGALRLKGSRK